jgi:hypothetical protein
LNAALFLDDATADNNYYEQIAERGFTLRWDGTFDFDMFRSPRVDGDVR